MCLFYLPIDIVSWTGPVVPKREYTVVEGVSLKK